MNILLVEDDTFFQKFYSLKLGEAGFQVMIAGNGEEGLQKAAETHPDLILLDIVMPKKDGFEVLKSLAADEKLKTIPVLVFSTLGQEEDVARAKQLGARDYVNKSFFDFDTLHNKINEILTKTSP